MSRKGQKTKVGSDIDPIIQAVPMACCDETAAVDFMEAQRWGNKPACPLCQSDRVYKMLDAKTGQRNKRFLWRCHACKKQYTVKIGTVMEESRIPVRHWCYAFWRACTSKKGAAALEIKRHTGLTYKSALFMMHRIKEAMHETGLPKLAGEIESDEVWIGGRTRKGSGKTDKVPVMVMIQRDGQARLRVLNRVTAKNLRAHLCREVDPTRSTLYTDELMQYRNIGRREVGGRNKSVRHSYGEYSRAWDGAGVNRCESMNAIIKRGIMGIYHNVSRHHLHRYLREFQFRWNHREMTDGDRLRAAIKGAVGKRLMYREPVTKI